MLPVVGFVVVFFSAVGGFIMAGGNPFILFQPIEYLVILGTGVGALFIGVPMKMLKQLASDVPKIFSGYKYHKEDYLRLLLFLTVFLKKVKTKGFLAVEEDIEHPEDSELFSIFPVFKRDSNILIFIQEYLRTLSIGVENPYHLDEIISQEIDHQSHAYLKESSKVMSTLGDSLPALGIVAAVLGVILAMAAIAEPPEILGHLIGAALVGTFFGVFVSYGIVSPISGHLAFINEHDMYMQKCIHQVLSAFLHGYAPLIAVEFGRKILPLSCKPSFQEVEEAVSGFNPKTAKEG